LPLSAAGQSAPPAATPGPPPPSNAPPGNEPPPPLAESPLNTRAQPEPAPVPPPAASESSPPEPEAPPPAAAEPESPGPDFGPFSRGSKRLSILLGTASTGSDTYFILGGGIGYFVVNGLELGLDYEAWLFGDPFIHRLSPGVRYVFGFVPTIKPYVGVFYRHTFVEDYDDFDQWGARAGIFYAPRRARVFIGGGAVYERLFDCTSSSVVDCDSVYPELMVGISF
jgi:hypothetical protein